MDSFQSFLQILYNTVITKYETYYAFGVQICMVLGVLTFLRILLFLLSSFYRYFLRYFFSHNLFKRYGPGWAVITGATDGIGLQYCFQLAQKRFNLIMIARNSEKLIARKAEIQKHIKNEIKIELVTLDFGCHYSEENYSSFTEVIKEKEIAILVNNVGGGIPLEVAKCKAEEMLNIINVNVTSTTFMTKLILPSMVERSKMCGIINISSGTECQNGWPYLQMYAASKAFVSSFGNSMAKELKKYKIDVLTVICGPVTTNINPLNSPFHTSAETAVRSQLRCLGKETHSHTHWKHGLQNYLSSSFYCIRWLYGSAALKYYPAFLKSNNMHALYHLSIFRTKPKARIKMIKVERDTKFSYDLINYVFIFKKSSIMIIIFLKTVEV
jgi:17beta-estradiol 17-dehydrogenase / very-long-chain 3-oxoacyl-CoA reductase